MKSALSDITPLFYLGIRFVIAGILMVIIFNKNLRNMRLADLKAGLIVGFFLATSFSSQIIGLQFTTPGKSGFLSNASVIIVPFILWIVQKNSPGSSTILGAIISFVGLGVLSLTSQFTIELGDCLMLLSALLFTGQIVYTGIYAAKVDSMVLATVQIVVTGICCIAGAFMTEPLPSLTPSLNVWGAIGYGVIFCTMIAFILQSTSQKITPSSHAAIILCMEAVFAMFFAVIFGLDHFTLRSAIGSALVLFGFITVETNWFNSKRFIRQRIE